MTESDLVERLSVGFHESGHAVVARYFGKVLKRVSLKRPSSGRPWYGETKCEPGQPPRHPRDEAVILLAGFAADHYRDPNSVNWDSFCNDDRYASDRNKLDAVLGHCVPADADDNFLDTIIKPELCRARWIVEQLVYWDAIRTVATRLAEVEEMTGQEAMKIIDHAFQTIGSLKESGAG